MEGIKRFPRIFEPGEIGKLRLKNRIVMAGMGTGAVENGRLSRQHLAYFAERAKGGVGLITTEMSIVNTRISDAGGLRMDTDQFIFGHPDLISLLHAYEAKACLQLSYPGRRNVFDLNAGWTLAVPSSMAAADSPPAGRPGLKFPHEFTLDEIYELIESFGSAAGRARRAGYDIVEIHGAHGYLAQQFMSPVTNIRTDSFGGALENRIRFPVEVIKRIKREAGEDFPIIFRITAEETMEWPGYTLEDAKFFAGQLETAGADALHVTMGSYADADGVSRNTCPMSYAQGWRLPYIEEIKKVVSVPIIAVGTLREPEFVEDTLAQGKADFIAMGRQFLADAYWVKKTATGKAELIRKCTSCNYCNSSMGRSPVHCAVNPVTGREADFAQLPPALTKKRVMVIGAGPAGMAAALVAAQRGYEVALYEKGASLGAGQLALTSLPPHKEKMKWVGEGLAAEVQEAKIEVHLNTEVNAQVIAEAQPEVVIVATGARPFIPDIPGVGNQNVVTAHDVLAGRVKIEGQRVAVLGQFSTGAETAEYLVEKGNQVTIVARSSIQDLARGSYWSTRFDLIARLRRNKKIAILNGCHTLEIKEDGISVADQDNKESFIKIDRVVLARGVLPVNELSEPLRDKIAEVYTIGDAAEPRDIAAAIYEGWIIARGL